MPHYPSPIHRFFHEVWNENRLETIEEIVTHNTVIHGAGKPEDRIVGPQAMRAFVQGLRAGFSDVQVEITHHLENDSLVLVRWVATLTHTGTFQGIPATGRRFSVTGMSLARLENGTIAEGWENWDTLGLLQAIGALPVGA